MTWQLSNHEANVSPLPCLTPFEGPCVAHEPYSSCLQSPNNKASLTHYIHSAKVHSEKCKSDHVFPLSKILPLILITYRIKSKFLNGQAWASQSDPSSLSSLISCHYLPPCSTTVGIYANAAWGYFIHVLHCLEYSILYHVSSSSLYHF